MLQVWDLTGRKLFNFDGHEAPVYSICPHQKENIQVQLQIVYEFGFQKKLSGAISTHI